MVFVVGLLLSAKYCVAAAQVQSQTLGGVTDAQGRLVTPDRAPEPAMQPKVLTEAQHVQALSIQLEEARDRLLITQLQQRAQARESAWKQLETAVGCPIDKQTVTLACPTESR